MNDVVVLAIISNAFWLTLFFVCVGVFRREIRSLLGSLNSFSVAGSHFELGSKNLTLKSYSILSEIFLNVLCNSPDLHKLAEQFSDVDIHHLTKFTTKYLLEAPKGETNFLLIRNVAYMAGRKGRLPDALALYTFLLERAPSDMDLRNDLGCLLISKNPTEAKKIFEALIEENPGVLLYRLNNVYANIWF